MAGILIKDSCPLLQYQHEKINGTSVFNQIHEPSALLRDTTLQLLL